MMITGGYNIIDFEGQEFAVNKNITVDSSTVDKLKDITKPCVAGNFYINSENGLTFFGPIFTDHYIVSGNHTHVTGDVAISVAGDTTIIFAV